MSTFEHIGAVAARVVAKAISGRDSRDKPLSDQEERAKMSEPEQRANAEPALTDIRLKGPSE